MVKKKGMSPAEIRKAAPEHLRLLKRYLMSDDTLKVRGWDGAMEKGGFISLKFRKKVYGVHKKMFRVAKNDRNKEFNGKPFKDNFGAKNDQHGTGSLRCHC